MGSQKINWYKVWNKKKNNEVNKKVSVNDLLALNGFDKHSLIKKKDYLNFIKILRKILKINKKKKIFEFGCGSGLLLYLLKKHSKSVSGYDFSKPLIRVAQKVLKQRKDITFSKNFLKKKNQYDVVIMNSVMQYLDYKSSNKIIFNLIKLSKKYLFIGDVLEKSKQKKYFNYRKKYYGDQVYSKKYNGLKHTFFDYYFFKKIAKKNNLKVYFYKNIIKNYKQGQFRFNVVLLKN